MQTIWNSIRNIRKSEIDIFFDDVVLNPDQVLDDLTLQRFKKLIIKFPTEHIEERFFPLFAKQEGYVLSRVMIFFFLFINWCSLNEITAISNTIKANHCITLKDQDVFKDEDDAHCFYFNHAFKQYLLKYMKDIRNIYSLKNGNINPRKYAEMLIDGSIGYEGLFFYMRRFNHSMALFENFNFLLTERRAHTGFRYVAEAVARQLFEEFEFIKRVLAELVRNYDTIAKEASHIDFLVFYENLIWKNKTLEQIHTKFDWFFTENMIKFPDLISVERADSEKIDAALIEHQKEKDDRKYQINEDLLYDRLSEKATEFFGKFTEMASSNKDAPMFSTKSILNKLNFENSARVVIPETKGNDADN